MSSAYEKLPIDRRKVADSENKLPIEERKVADTIETANNHNENVLIKMPIEVFTKRYMEHSYNEPTILNLRHIYDAIDVNQIFGSAYLVKILSCS